MSVDGKTIAETAEMPWPYQWYYSSVLALLEELVRLLFKILVVQYLYGIRTQRMMFKLLKDYYEKFFDLFILTGPHRVI